jgi:hypothetical protein
MRFTLLLVSLAITIPVSAETITLTPSDDASVRDGINGVNENASWLDVFDSSSIPRHTFIKFDLSDHSDDVTGDDITSATLRVYIQRVLRAGEVTFAIPNVDWDEGSLTGNDYPTSFSNSSYATADIKTSDKADYLEIDITDIAQDWFDGGDNYGIAILPTSGDNARIKLGSQRVSSKRPEVVIETTDTLSIAYESWPITLNLTAFTLTNNRTYFQIFVPPAKVSYSKAEVFIGKNSVSTNAGYIGVAIYSNEGDSGSENVLSGSHPDELLTSGSSPWQPFNTGEQHELVYKTIEFDAPITLQPTKRYWMAVGIDAMTLLYMPYYVDYSGNSEQAFYENNSFFNTEFIFNGNLVNSEYPFWFRLVP